jgi:hypothetical protein
MKQRGDGNHLPRQRIVPLHRLVLGVDLCVKMDEYENLLHSSVYQQLQSGILIIRDDHRLLLLLGLDIMSLSFGELQVLQIH